MCVSTLLLFQMCFCIYVSTVLLYMCEHCAFVYMWALCFCIYVSTVLLYIYEHCAFVPNVPRAYITIVCIVLYVRATCTLSNMFAETSVHITRTVNFFTRLCALIVPVLLKIVQFKTDFLTPPHVGTFIFSVWNTCCRNLKHGYIFYIDNWTYFRVKIPSYIPRR